MSFPLIGFMEEVYCQEVILLPPSKFAIKFRGKLYNCIWSWFELIISFKKPDRGLLCKYPEKYTLTSVCAMSYSWCVIARPVSLLATGSASQYGFSSPEEYYVRTLLRRSTLATSCCEWLSTVRWIPRLGNSTSVCTWVTGVAASAASCSVSTFSLTRDTTVPSLFTARFTDLIGPYDTAFFDILRGLRWDNIGNSYENIYFVFIISLCDRPLHLLKLYSFSWHDGEWIYRVINDLWTLLQQMIS